MTDLYNNLEAIFHPRSIAFVGIITSNPFHWTRTFWDAARKLNFKGNIYPVNPKGGEIDGHIVYTNLEDLPAGVDYAICTVAARTAPEIVRQCAARGVKAIHLCTAGFAETGEADVAGLQKEISETARRTGIRVIGPNCMGLYCPKSRVSWDADFPPESGSVGLISQSGSNANTLIREAAQRGIRFSKAVSFGNACDLNECDFLEYMMEDPETKIIALYLEGISDGSRFFKLIKQISGKKPVVLIKGGYGSGGARATATHTASLAGSNAMWDTFCRQMNVMRVTNIQQLVDLLVALTFVPGISGRNAALIGVGGGATVIITDEFERRGFNLPALPHHLFKELLSFSQAEGNMLHNPIDFSQSMHLPGALHRAIKLLTDWDDIDFCVSFFSTGPMSEAHIPSILGMDILTKVGEVKTAKPLISIFEEGLTPSRNDLIFKLRQKVSQASKPVFYRFGDAADALKAVIDYNQRRLIRN